MQIQWYPGHMHKASKQIKETLPKVDVIIEILDARIPYSSENPVLKTLRGDKPCIKILSKNDLADPEITQLWQTYFEQEHGVKTLALSLLQGNTNDSDKVRQLPDLCRKLVPAKQYSVKIIHTMIVGIPNVGKSTLINTVTGRAITKTGNEPAVTKMQQRINLGNGIVLSDTPGVLWPNIENKNAGFRLAATGAIKGTAMDYVDVAFFTASYLLQTYPTRLKERYNLETLPTSELELLETIGAKRGCLRAGGQVDLNKASTLFLNDLRSGILGRISFETPNMMETELEEVRIIQEKKAAKKSLRKKKRKGL